MTCFRFVLFVILLIVAAVYYLGLYLSHTDTRVRSDIAPIAAKSAARCPTHPAPNPLLTPSAHPPPPSLPPQVPYEPRRRLERESLLASGAQACAACSATARREGSAR